MIKNTIQFIFILLIIFFVSSIPSVIVTNTFQGQTTVDFQLKGMIDNFQSFIVSLKNGTFGTYYLNNNERSVMDDIQSYTINSILLLFFSVCLSVTVSLIFAVFLYHWKISYLIRSISNILAIIPDFILIILSIALAVEFYQLTDIRVITLSPIGESANLWFPIIILSFVPTFYLFKVISSKYEEICGEDYIRTSVSKGLSRQVIHLQHVYRNLKPYFFADLKKAISLTIGSLFIIEYLFNIRGLTLFIFGEYQFQKVFISMLLLLGIATVCYFVIKMIFFLLEKVLTHD